MELVIITGLSGAGKSRAANFLEDEGFYTVDNIPADFMPRFAEFCLHSSDRFHRVAMVSDVRAGEDFSALTAALEERERKQVPVTVLFMEADLPTNIRRYQETRRVHPLAVGGLSLEQAVQREQALLGQLRERATYVLNTTPFTSTTLLQRALAELFRPERRAQGLEVTVMSFGYKYGIPLEADLVFDVRFLPNPYYVEQLRPQTGQDAAVADYLSAFPVTGEFLDKMEDMLRFLLQRVSEEGKRTLTLAIGCTGGRHRSVAMTCRLAECMTAMGYGVNCTHRDLNRG